MFTSMLAYALCLVCTQSPEAKKPAVVPFEIIGSKHMAVQIKINGKGPYRVIFDTGAPISLLSNKVAEESGLIKKSTTTPKSGSSSGTANLFASMKGMHKISDFQFGDVKAKNIQVIVMDHPTVAAIAEVVGPIEGIIGFPFFAKFHTSVNYQNKTLTMIPTSYDPGDVMASLMTSMMSSNKDKKVFISPKTFWGLSVGKGENDTEDGIEVVTVYPDSLAHKAGIQAGDRLITLDGVWTDTVTDCYRAAAQVAAGRTVKVKIRRDGKEQTLDVTPGTGW